MNWLFFAKQHLRTAAIGVIGLAIMVGVYVVWIRNPNQPQKTTQTSETIATSSTRAELAEDVVPLQIPLATTTHERADFERALRLVKTFPELRTLYEAWIDRIGANGIIDTLQRVDPQCHDVAHDLGRLIFTRTQSVGDALRACDSACNSGCMHGVLMEFFTKTPKNPEDDHMTLAEVKEKIGTVCGNTAQAGNPIMAKTYKQGDCVHGVGHAIMFLSGYKIPKAMAYCEAFDSPVLKYYCATGAYMEYVTTHDAADTQAHPDDPFFPCDAARYPAACFRYKMVHVLPRWYHAGKTLEELEAKCLSLKNQYQVGCFHGIGNGHLVYVASQRATLARICQAGSRDDMYACTEGLIERMGRYLPDLAKAQCETVTGWQQDLCKTDVQHELYDLTKPFDLYVP